MKGEAGYTLVEMLAALAVISLAFAGLGQGVHVLGRYQEAAASNLEASEHRGAAQEALQGALARVKTEDVLYGDARRLEARCPSDGACGDRFSDAVLSVRQEGQSLVLTPGPDYAFSYQSTSGAAPGWPSTEDASLVGVALAPRDGLPIAYARLREQQDFHCVYDVVVASCRTATP